MKRETLKRHNIRFFDNWKYRMVEWDKFDYSILSHILSRKKSGNTKSKEVYNECIMMLDTETSKIKPNTRDQNGKILPVPNMVVCWSLAIRDYTSHKNIVTLYGRKPSDVSKCLIKIHNSMSGNTSVFYVHFLSYDWQFLRKFLIQSFGCPEQQLNTKSHYPIIIKFNNGIQFRDSLILAQRTLEKWGKDMNAEHAKAVGAWDYNKLRDQHTPLDEDEKLYIQNDVLCGVECLDAMMIQLHKNITSIPFTATGIPREQVRKLAEQNNYHLKFLNIVPDYETHQVLEKIYHGGFTHGNRFFINCTMDDVQGFDFASSYPFVMLTEKYPMSRFRRYLRGEMSVDQILKHSEKYALIFKFIATGVTLKDAKIPMPVLQYSKCEAVINPLMDNGRILEADYISIWITEIDLKIISEQYSFEDCKCIDVMYSIKQYLPRWFTDYIYQCFRNKTMLKGGDPVEYALSKSVVNSLYGMTVQKPVKEDIIEDYDTGEYNISLDMDMEEEYNKYINRRKSVLPYQWGCYVTAYALRNLFKLGSCAGLWLYSDTDSCYGIRWNYDKVNEYNNNCIQKLKERGYEGIQHKGKTFYLGVAESDGDKDKYTEFRYQGAKRYCGRCKEDGELHITVAGVPKKNGVLCLRDDINNFVPGLIFDGKTTGKTTHYYIQNDKIEIDKNGNEIGDSIDLVECDYLLSSVYNPAWEELSSEVLQIAEYG